MKIINRKKFNILPKGIIFDLDNTLYEYDICNKKATDHISKIISKKFQITHHEFKKFFELGRTEIKNRLGKTASSHSRLLYIKEAFEIMKVGSQIETIIELEQQYWNKYLESANLFDNAIQFLKLLKDNGIILTCLTNLNTNIQLKKIFYFELQKIFDFVITSEEVGFEKPNKSMFLLAKDRMELNDHEIWIIGDDIEADMRGARNSLKASTTVLKSKFDFNKHKYDFIDAYFFDYKKIYATFLKILSNDV